MNEKETPAVAFSPQDDSNQANAGPSAAATPRRTPRDCGAFDIRIARDGTWWHAGTPFTRMPLVKLFASVLERDAAGTYWLSTPAERGTIAVEDAPFIAVELTSKGTGREQVLIFRTNVDDIVEAGEDHPLRVVHDPATGAPSPYVLVRKGLEARLSRAVFYQLVELGGEERIGGVTRFGAWSKGRFFFLDETPPT